MAVVKVDFSVKKGSIKNMNSVNNGPKVRGRGQWRDNEKAYKALHIPNARTHDASICYDYGAEHCVDVNGIFPDFEADPYNSDNYDFLITDRYLESIINAGTEPYYRLGSRIEHWDKKYNTLPPKNFKKWAVICEHIIAHYTEGWADGFNWNIEYWEIWNEPETWDGQPAITKNCWGGTAEEFFDFYEIAAKHLKNRFPDLKIGGPALCCDHDWGRRFTKEMHKRGVPLDFYSWHIYTDKVYKLGEDAANVREYLDEAGYDNAESHLNEWNYIGSWTEEFVDTLIDLKGEKGAAFVAAMMIEGQRLPLDMMMYYDARCDAIFNGLFDIVTLRPQKPYYSFAAFSEIAGLGTEVAVENDVSDIYALASTDGNNICGMVAYYTDCVDSGKRTVELELLNFYKSLEFYEISGEKCFEKIEPVQKDGAYIFKVNPQTVIFYRSKVNQQLLFR